MKQRMKALSGIFFVGFVLNAAFLPNPAVGAGTPSRYEPPQLLLGTIYAANSGQKRVLYKFKRAVTRSGDTVTAVREFTAPDGSLAARETAVYEGDNLVSYDLEELQIQARGTVKLSRGSKTEATIAFQYVSGTNPKRNASTESLRPDTLISDMLAPFLAAHWNDLLKGKEVKCRYVAAARAETVGFKFVKHAESTVQGKPAVIIKMAPSSFLIAALVDPLFFTMEKDGAHRVLQYDGRTTPKIKDGSRWKDLDAVTVFDWN
jgi:hypothetical protein